MRELRRRDALTVFGSLSASLGAMFGVTLVDSTRERGDERPESDGAGPSSRTNGSAPSSRVGASPSEVRDDTTDLAYPNDVRTRAHATGRPLSTITRREEWTATGGTTAGWQDVGGETAKRLVSPASATRPGMSTTFAEPLDLTTLALSVGVSLDRPAEEIVQLRAFAPDEDNQLYMQRYLQRRAGTVRLDVAPGRTIGSPDPTAVEGLSIESFTGAGKPIELGVGGLRVRESPRRRGAVILTFDDGHHTQLDVAKPILDEFGYPGVVGVVPWLVEEDDRISARELHGMVADGWEMASHPQRRDTPLPTLSKSRQRDAIERSKRWFVEEGFAGRGETLIWPFGAFDERTLDLVGEYHRLAFGGGASPAPWAITEPGWVPRVNGDDPAAVRQAVDAAARFGTVATVMYHTIGEHRLSADGLREQLRYIDRADVDVTLPSKLADAQPY
ncbi:polysaccharide deacetylase family protein [Halococcus agarilyticus]|uniref:polysaccharide deacetylase family protein n=1 Tax=Halococcus agarilyticus TaxID=1232219 RepID=UPI00067773A6|nr:polysaccharide deacetylase family protein [Halococcus agarilyticus]